jgi:hypothetical protein
MYPVRRDPSLRFDCLDRRKLILLVTFAGGQDDHAWSFQTGIAVRRRASGKSDGRAAFEHKHEPSYTISKQ